MLNIVYGNISFRPHMPLKHTVIAPFDYCINYIYIYIAPIFAKTFKKGFKFRYFILL